MNRPCWRQFSKSVSMILEECPRWLEEGTGYCLSRIYSSPRLLDEAVVTHPAVVEAIASMVIDAGATPFIGDSPPLGNLPKVLLKCGYEPFMKKMAIQAVPFVEKLPVEFSTGRLFRRMDLAREVFEFDAVINLAKLKTHTQMMLTLAVKNLFGTVIGTDKASWHLRAGKDVDCFATVLVQIFEKIRPVLSIVDGILAMEGNGPNSGDARHVGILGASTDAVALDSIICACPPMPWRWIRSSADWWASRSVPCPRVSSGRVWGWGLPIAGKSGGSETILTDFP